MTQNELRALTDSIAKLPHTYGSTAYGAAYEEVWGYLKGIAKERKERKEQDLYFYVFSAFFRG